MPWKDCTVMLQRREFVMLAEKAGADVSGLCRRFGISRKTGYKWIGRSRSEGEAGLVDRSRRPHRSPKRSGEVIERAVIEVRQKHPAWGGRKLRRVLLNQGEHGLQVPAASTIGEILKRHGMIDEVESEKHRAFVRFEKMQPNELWQMDFKGHVAMRNGQRCHPLTVLDDHSRFNVGLIACADERTETAQKALTGLLERYGQPRRILCDNGSPWGSCGGEPYTRLGVWLMLHGIGISHGRAYHPQTQGKDERFHRTFNVELLSRELLADLSDSQNRFVQWREIYNCIRPHEALGMQPPISRWRPSERAYDPNPPSPEYPASDAVRKVDVSGRLSFRGRNFRIGQAFVKQRVGLRASETDGVMKVIFAEQEIGQLDLRKATEAMCCSGPSVATLPKAPNSTESVTHVSEQVLPLTPA
jgi:transposase InsO family protein